jgi:divalent metal cation (Fe/Co/Zn/Cd) transporter
MSAPTILDLPVASGPAPATRAPARAKLARRARLLAWAGIGWHVAEAVVAIGAGLAAGSIALIGFGADSLIEGAAGLVVAWLFAASRTYTAETERRAQQLVAASFFILAAYVGVEAIRTLASADHPGVSWVGIGLSIVTLLTMPPLAVAKTRVGRALGSSATASEARQTYLCAFLSAGLLVGLGANALAGWWWADPIAALLVAGVAVREGATSWRGDDSCCAVPGVEPEACEDDCCA